MKIRHLLQGRLFGVPIHPLLIHFPIAAFVMSFVLDVAGFSGYAPWAARASFSLLVIGILTGLFAAIFGLADFKSIRRDSEAYWIAGQHAFLNVLVIGIYLFSLLARVEEPRVITFPALVISLIGLLTLAYSGYLGSELVYSHGVAAGRHRRGTEEPPATISVQSAGGDFVDVVADGELGEGDSRRVDINGTVLVLARSQGKLFAFQEFCTHRCGPLSEGSYENCEVTCPWHKSVFDMRTGEVKHGPAKEPIKTFPVQVQNGMVQVRVAPAAQPVALNASS